MHDKSASKSPFDCMWIDVLGQLHGLTKHSRPTSLLSGACSGLRMADTIFLTLPVALLQTWIGMRCSHPGCGARHQTQYLWIQGTVCRPDNLAVHEQLRALHHTAFCAAYADFTCKTLQQVCWWLRAGNRGALRSGATPG